MRQPQIAGVVSGQIRGNRQFENTVLVDGDHIDRKPLAQSKRRRKRLALLRMPAAFDKADVRQLERKQTRGEQAATVKLCRDNIRVRLREQQCRDRRGVDNFSDYRGRAGL